MQTDFQPGDVVEFCGDEATVVQNYGSYGVVSQGCQMMKWYWEWDKTLVTLVRRAKLNPKEAN